jgi:hypothetical protein
MTTISNMAVMLCLDLFACNDLQGCPDECELASRIGFSLKGKSGFIAIFKAVKVRFAFSRFVFNPLQWLRSAFPTSSPRNFKMPFCPIVPA